MPAWNSFLLQTASPLKVKGTGLAAAGTEVGNRCGAGGRSFIVPLVFRYSICRAAREAGLHIFTAELRPAQLE